jgi:hypothetical protein
VVNQKNQNAEGEPVSKEQAEAEKKERLIHEFRLMLGVFTVIFSFVCVAVSFVGASLVVVIVFWTLFVFGMGLGYLASGQHRPLRPWTWSWSLRKKGEQGPGFWVSTDNYILQHAGPPAKYLWRLQVSIPAGAAYFIEGGMILAGLALGQLLVSIVCAVVASSQTIVLVVKHLNGRKKAKIADGTEVLKIRNRDLVAGYKENEYPLMGIDSWDERPMTLKKLEEDFRKTIKLLSSRSEAGVKKRASYLSTVLGLDSKASQLTDDQEAFLQVSYQEFFGTQIEYCPHCGRKIKKTHSDFCACGAYLARYNGHRPHCYYVTSVYGYSFYAVLKTGDMDLTLPKELVTYRLRSTKARYNERFASTVSMFPLLESEEDPKTGQRETLVKPVFYVRDTPPGLDQWGPSFTEDAFTRSNIGNESVLKLESKLSASEMTTADLQDQLTNFGERGMLAIWRQVKAILLMYRSPSDSQGTPLPANPGANSPQGALPQQPGSRFSRLKYFLIGFLPPAITATIFGFMLMLKGGF